MIIYCLEDDISIQELLKYSLIHSNHQVSLFKTAKEFYTTLAKQKPNLILLDLMLPDDQGINIIKQLKHNHSTNHIPIIVISAKNSDFDKVLCLDNGAEDYITKPFSIVELISRIKVIERRYYNNQNKFINYKTLSLSTSQRKVYIDNNEINLTLKEFELLLALLLNLDNVISREQLLEKIWGYDYYGESRTVDVHIRTLRSKIKQYSSNIQTIRGIGYKFEK